MTDDAILDERPTTIRSLADWVARFVDESELLFDTSSGHEVQWNMVSDWLRRYAVIAEWSKRVATRIDPVISRGLPFAPVGTNQFDSAGVRARRYLDSLTSLSTSLLLWADERALFGEVADEDVWVLAPGGPFTAWLVLDAILETPSEMTIVDPYVDLDVLALVARKAQGQPARVLTDEARRNRIASDVARLRVEHPNIEVRYSAATDLPHDRFLLTGDAVYLSGASLKDAGRRMSVVIRVSLTSAAAAIRTEVDGVWVKATP